MPEGLIVFDYRQAGPIAKQAMRVLSERNFRFAVAKALTLTAQAIKEDLASQLGQHMTVRDEPFLRRGLRTRMANFKSSEMEALVGDIDDFMAKMAVGGRKKAKLDKLLGVPNTGKPEGPRPTVQSRIRRRDWPSTLLRKYNAYVAGGRVFQARETSEDGDTMDEYPYDYFPAPYRLRLPRPAQDPGQMAIYKITNRDTHPRSIRQVYRFARSVQIPKKWPFAALAEQAALRHWPRIMRQEFNAEMMRLDLKKLAAGKWT